MTTERKDHYKAGTADVNLNGYETVYFFEDDCDIAFTAKFHDNMGYSEDETIEVCGVNESIEVTSLLTEDKIEDFYRKAMSVRGKM